MTTSNEPQPKSPREAPKDAIDTPSEISTIKQLRESARKDLMRDVWEKAPNLATHAVAPLIDALTRIERADMTSNNGRIISDPQFESHRTINAFADRPRLSSDSIIVDVFMNALVNSTRGTSSSQVYETAHHQAVTILDLFDDRVLGRPKKLDY